MGVPHKIWLEEGMKNHSGNMNRNKEAIGVNEKVDILKNTEQNIFDEHFITYEH